MSSSAFISQLVSCFSSRVLRSRSLLLTEERGLRRRQELRFLVSNAILLTALPRWWVFSPTMSREASLAIIVLWFTKMFLGETLSGCRRTNHTVNFVHVIQLFMEFRSQRSSFHFSPSGSETTNQSCVAPLHLYNAKFQEIPSLNLNLTGSSSLSSTLSFDGNPDYSGEPVFLPASTIHLLINVICTTSNPACPFASGTREISMWAWPNSFAEASNPIIKILKLRLSDQSVRYLVMGLISLDNLKISYGFIGIFILRLLQYHFFRKHFSVVSTIMIWFSSSSSDEESTSPPYLPPMNGDVLSGSIPGFCFNLLTGLSPCVAVCMGPEGAIEITLVFLVGEGFPSTSLVTISQLSDFVVKAFPTHSIFVLNSLSSSSEDLSCLMSLLFVVYDLSPRGCLIPSCLCSP